LRNARLLSLVLPVLVAVAYGPFPAAAGAAPGIGNVVTQSAAAYAKSYKTAGVTNVFATPFSISVSRFFGWPSKSNGIDGASEFE